MSFRSTLSTFCFQIIIALLVQQRIIVCASECFCQCNQRLVCDELQRLATSDANHVGQWTKWKTYLMYLKTLHRDFDPEVWSERIISVENKAESIEGLKEKLKDTESHVTRLETTLENVRKEFEEKMADFAQKMLGMQSQAVTLEKDVNKAEKKITATQIQIINIEKRVDFVENQTNSIDHAIKEEEKFKEQFGDELIRNTSKRFYEVEKQYEKLKDDYDTKLLNIDKYTKLLQSSLEEEKSARNIYEVKVENNLSTTHVKLEEIWNKLHKFAEITKLTHDQNILTLEILQTMNTDIINIETRVGFVENQTNSFEQTVEAEEKPRKQLAMYISTLEKEMQLVKNQIKHFENVTEAEKEAKEQLDVKISTIEEKMNITENEIKRVKPDIELEKRARQQLDELLRNTSKRFYEVEKQYEILKDDYDTKLLNIDKYTKLLQSSIEEEKSARNIYEAKVENNLSTTHVKLTQIWNELHKFAEIAKLTQEQHILTVAALQAMNEEIAVIKATLVDMAMLSRGRRALKRSVNEIRKGPSKTETEAVHQNSNN